jgi:hypothetical protein
VPRTATKVSSHRPDLVDGLDVLLGVVVDVGRDGERVGGLVARLREVGREPDRLAGAGVPRLAGPSSVSK